jgi:hypothetical protein
MIDNNRKDGGLEFTSFKINDGVKSQEKYKLEGIRDCSNNPFLLAIKITTSTAMRSFKFWLLHKDIFFQKVGCTKLNLLIIITVTTAFNLQK